MFITTKRGDNGCSDYFGKRVSKGGKLLEALGTLDELQAVLGLAGLEKLEMDIYEIMARKKVGNKIEVLESKIKKLEKEVKIPKDFLIFSNS